MENVSEYLEIPLLFGSSVCPNMKLRAAYTDDRLLIYSLLMIVSSGDRANHTFVTLKIPSLDLFITVHVGRRRLYSVARLTTELKTVRIYMVVRHNHNSGS